MQLIAALAAHAGDAQGLIAYDVGAHRGGTVAEWVMVPGLQRVVAFEPDPQNCAALRERFGGDARVDIREVGLGAADGVFTLHRNNYDATHSPFPIDPVVINRWADASDIVEIARIEAPVRSVDSLVASGEAPPPRLIKIDVQGGELSVLTGARATLAGGGVAAILLEVEFLPLYLGQPLFADVHRFLSAAGYHPSQLLEPKVRADGTLVWADALYVRE